MQLNGKPYAPTVSRMPDDYRWATAYEAETWTQQPDVIQVVTHTDPFYGDIVAYAVPKALLRDCDREFGDHEHDDMACELLLYDMSGAGVSRV